MRLQVETNAVKMDPGLAEELQEELARLSNYVETALTIARAEQGRLELKPEALGLEDFVSDVVEPFSRLADAERRRLLWSCPKEATAWTDRNALKQILFNVLNNALKHGREDILLRVRSRGSSVWFLIGNRSANEGLNNGKGGSGLGIGLRLVRALAGQMDGTRIAFRTKPHFWVRLRVPSVGLAMSPQTRVAQYEKQTI
jgi:signal transduction histidine kinase